jgi:RHS repeat-associated protein
VWGEPTEVVDALKDKYMGVAPSYTGHSYDNVLDIYFAHSRFYDPDTRAWMSKDRARDGNNWYRYVNDNPTSYSDPTGEFLDILIGAAVGAAGGALFGIAVQAVSDIVSGNAPQLENYIGAAVGGAAGGALIGATKGAILASPAGLAVYGATVSGTQTFVTEALSYIRMGAWKDTDGNRKPHRRSF